jgi:hypothetical protein
VRIRVTAGARGLVASITATPAGSDSLGAKMLETYAQSPDQASW